MTGLSADPFAEAVSGVTDRIVAALLPKLTPIVKQAAEAAEPTIRTVVREEVIPQAGVWAVAGLAAAAAVGALVGYLVSRR